MLVVYGTVCLDRIRRVERLPEKGGYAEITSELDLLGGEAANTALALAAWGADVLLFGNPIGTGVDADLLLGMLRASGVNQVEFSTDRGHGGTPVCDIYVTPDGERTMFGRGFSDLEDRMDLTNLRGHLRAGSWFTAEPNHGVAAREAVRMAAEAGCKIYLLDFLKPDDPMPRGSYWQASTDWIGVRGNTQRNVALVQDLVARNQVFAVLSDGPNGFVAGGLGHSVHAYPPFPCPDLVDSTGAGDVFRAGMLLGLGAGWGLGDCLRFASAAGCLNCLGLGGSSQVPSRKAIERLIQANPQVSRAYEL